MADLRTIDLEDCARRVEAGMRATIEGVLMAGRALAEARQVLVGDREFGRWREQRLPWLTVDTARNFRRVWNRFGSAAVQPPPGLCLTVLYELARPSTDDETIEAVFDQHRASGRVKVGDIKQIRGGLDRSGGAKPNTEICWTLADGRPVESVCWHELASLERKAREQLAVLSGIRAFGVPSDDDAQVGQVLRGGELRQIVGVALAAARQEGGA